MQPVRKLFDVKTANSTASDLDHVDNIIIAINLNVNFRNIRHLIAEIRKIVLLVSIHEQSPDNMKSAALGL